MNKYLNIYLNALSKKASEKDKGLLGDSVRLGADRQQAQQISDKLKAIKSNLTSNASPTPTPSANTEKPKFIKGIPVGAKPSEADLNGVLATK